jgi:tetratricopeptide (TPR) repeat protein
MIGKSLKVEILETQNQVNDLILEIAGKQFQSGNVHAAICTLEDGIYLSYPDNYYLHNNLAYLHSWNGDLGKALYQIERALDIHETVPVELYCTKATIQKKLKLLDEAEKTFRKILELKPNDVCSQYELSYILLCNKKFREGLELNESRLKLAEIARNIRKYNLPIWDGKQDIKGMKLLIFNEMGDGDLIQGLRYIQQLKELTGAKLFLDTKEPLFLNFPDIDGQYEVCDYMVSINSLSLLFDPDLENTEVGSYITPKLEEMPKLIFLDEYRPRIGIVWAGNKWHPLDRHRSCHLHHFNKLADYLKESLISFQKGEMKRAWPVQNTDIREGREVEEIDLLGGSAFKFTDLSEYLIDYNITANYLKEIDLLITVDTAVAHLAGALGIKTWLLLSKAYDWRWQKKWYKSVEIMKQKTLDNWEELFDEVLLKLKMEIG